MPKRENNPDMPGRPDLALKLTLRPTHPRQLIQKSNQSSVSAPDKGCDREFASDSMIYDGSHHKPAGSLGFPQLHSSV